MKNLLTPRSVALIGASTNPEKLGYAILSNIVHSEYKGSVYPINPTANEILGKKTYASVKQVNSPIDLAVIAIPARYVLAVVDECIEKSIPNIVIISAGFKEIGGEGVRLEAELVHRMKIHNITLVGPNCLGIINTHIGLNASFGEGMPKKGNIALLSQSGAMAVAITDWASQENIGFSSIISLGNKAGINENDCLEFFEHDKNTDVILMYLESFVDGQRFMESARRVAMKKPVIVLKSGTSQAGSAAVSSHTGALAGGDVAVETALAQSGVIRAHTIEDFFVYAQMFSMQPIPKGNRIAVVTNAGGPGVITTDAIDTSRYVVLAPFDKKTRENLEGCLPSTANTHNPVDIIGDALADRYKSAFSAVLEDKNVDILLSILTPQIMTQKEDTVRTLVEHNAQYPKKTFVASFMGGRNIEYAAQKLEENRIPNFIYPHSAVRGLEAMIQLREWREKQKKRRIFVPENTKAADIRADILNLVDKDESVVLSPAFVTRILKNYGVTVPEVAVVKSAADAVEQAKKVGFPVVLKIVSEDVLHKTDSGGVRLGLESDIEVSNGYDDIMKNVKKNCPGASIDGVLVQKMYHMGREVLIGMKRDPVFGPLIAFGLGGIYVEVLKDVSFRVAPVSLKDAYEMIDEIKTVQLLKGVRGEAASDIDVLAKTIVQVSHIAQDIPEIHEIDLNPLMVFEKGAVALDGRMICE